MLIGPNLALSNRTLRKGGGVFYDADAAAFFARAAGAGVEPDTTRKTAIDTLIIALKAAGTWGLRDWYHFIGANATITGLNWRSSSHTLTPVNSPSFVADRYYLADGASSYLNINAVRNALTYFQQNSANLAAWETDNIGDNSALVGTSGAGFIARLAPRRSTDVVQHRINDTASLGSSVTSSIGWNSVNRSGASARQARQNNTELGADGVTSAALGTEVMYYLRDGTQYSTRRWAGGAGGGSLTLAQHQAEYAAILTYMQTIGAAP